MKRVIPKRSYTWEDPKISQFPTISYKNQAIRGVISGKSHILEKITYQKELHTRDIMHWEDL